MENRWHEVPFEWGILSADESPFRGMRSQALEISLQAYERVGAYADVRPGNLLIVFMGQGYRAEGMAIDDQTLAVFLEVICHSPLQALMMGPIVRVDERGPFCGI